MLIKIYFAKLRFKLNFIIVRSITVYKKLSKGREEN